MTKSNRVTMIQVLFLQKLGRRLRELRIKNQYSIEYVKSRTNIQSLEDIENGKESDMKDIFKLCNFYRVNIQHIFNKRKTK